jgi:hypothetical protein
MENDLIASRHEMQARLDWCRTVTSRKLTCEESQGRYQVALSRSALGFIPRKVDDLKSWFTDMLVRSFDELFRINPTPSPSISPANKEKAVDAAYQTIMMIMQQRTQQAVTLIGQEYLRMGIQVSPEQAAELAESRGMDLIPNDEEVREVVRGMRDTVFSHEMQEAIAGAKRLQREVSDAITHTKGFHELEALVSDYATYPFVIGEFCIKNAEVGEWSKKGEYKRTRKLKPSLSRVSPYDFYWTRDSTNTQDGMGIARRYAMRRYDIQDMKSRSYAFKDEIDRLLAAREDLSRNWVISKENPDATAPSWTLKPNETIDVFRMFILVSGFQLWDYRRHFKQTIDHDKQYQLEVWLCAGYLLGATLHDAGFERPYYRDSYEPVSGEFAGNSLPEVLATIDATGKKLFKLMLRNMAQTVDTTKLINRSMIGYDVIGEDEDVEPGQTYDFLPPIGGINTFRPVEQLSAENQIPKLVGFYEFMDNRADTESGIPRYAMGNAQGLPSALRSTESLVTMIDSALKVIKSRIFRLSSNVISPLIAKNAYYIMDNTKDYAMVVDADITAQGLDGVVTKGLVVGKIVELLQYLAPYAQNGMVSPSIIKSLINRYMAEAGVDEAYLAAVGGDELTGAMQQLNGGQQGGAGLPSMAGGKPPPQPQPNPLITARAG